MLYKFLKKLAKTSFFWKYRHIIQPDVWKSYANDSNNIRRNYYSDFMKEHKLKSIFKFGCGSAPNFLAIKKHTTAFYYYGYDISKEAINMANKNNVSSKFYFTDKNNLHMMNEFLKDHKLKKFDLTIFDRVLYMISENDLNNYLNKYSSILSYVIIDDFYSETPQWDEENYIYSKNYLKIFSKYGFEIIDIKDSKIPSKTAKKFAKILVLKK